MLENLQGSAREFERSAIRIRNFIGLTLYEALDPFTLADKLGMKVLDLVSVPGLSIKNVQTLLVSKANEWSGASSGVLSDGSIFIVLNPSQSDVRQRATLMEEICHVILGHRREFLPLNQGERSYNLRQETEAYAVGAAALLPYAALNKFMALGASDLEIAKIFKVSLSLVDYRYRMTFLRS